MQSHIVEERTRPDIPATYVDGIAELWYHDREVMARAHASPQAKALFADGALFIGRIKTYTIEEKVIVPGPPPSARRASWGIVGCFDSPRRAHVMRDLLVLFLALALMGSSSSSWASSASTAAEVTSSAGSALGTLVYAPFKATLCILGGIGSGFAAIASHSRQGRHGGLRGFLARDAERHSRA